MYLVPKRRIWHHLGLFYPSSSQIPPFIAVIVVIVSFGVATIGAVVVVAADVIVKLLLAVVDVVDVDLLLTCLLLMCCPSLGRELSTVYSVLISLTKHQLFSLVVSVAWSLFIGLLVQFTWV